MCDERDRSGAEVEEYVELKEILVGERRRKINKVFVGFSYGFGFVNKCDFWRRGAHFSSLTVSCYLFGFFGEFSFASE